jgi:hypothetical protein
MIHVVRIYQSAASRKNKAAQKILNSQTIQDLETSGRTGLTLASRSCSLLKVDPQVLHRHPVMGVRAALASLIRDGLNDNPSSPPHCRHKRLVRSPLLSQLSGDGAANVPTLGAMPRVGS